MLADYHIHSSYSDDSDYAMGTVVLDAINLGLDEICFTDHVDYGVKRDWDDPRGILYRRGGPGEPAKIPLANVDYPRYAAEIAMLRRKYRDKITVKMGMEFGMQQHTTAQYQKLFDSYPFDFIILSVHQVENRELWTQDYQRSKTQDEYNLGYYEEILTIVQQYHDYSVLGHLDLISRYDKQGRYPFEKIKPLVTTILKQVIRDGKGIEVNTSSRRYGLDDLMPSRDILKLYHSLGGRIITIGSDSHKQQHLGAYIAETKLELEKLGFSEYCTYEGMTPVFHQIH